MKYKYYPSTIKFITEKLKKKFPRVRAKEGLKNIPEKQADGLDGLWHMQKYWA
ncbi:hypothetical protein KKB69_00485 [Patescibacteria group bacterium]|nr:hypothetical protein [Patescibacteria group bacterium]